MVKLTPNAAAEILRRRSQEEGAQDKSLRVFVDKGCCMEQQYGLAFDSEVPGDEVFQGEDTQGITVLIDPHSLPLLQGMNIRFNDDGVQDDEFRIINPQAKKTCGCGKSFDT